MLDELTVRKGVEFAVTTEEVGQRAYKLLAKRFEDDPDLHDLFTALGEDEARHREQFAALLDTIPADEQVTNLDHRHEYLRAMSISEFFTGEGGLVHDLDEVVTRADALSRALRLEKDTLAFYQAIQDLLGDDCTLGMIIEAEKRHVTRIAALMV